MTLRVLILMILIQAARAATLEEGMGALRSADIGSVAFCKPSVVDELQIIGTPRHLSADESQQLGRLLGAEDTYFEKSADGDLISGHSLCLTHWDFKIILVKRDGGQLVAIRLCSGCRQIALSVDGKPVEDCPDIRIPAMNALAKRFDAWFPGWAKATERNRLKWEKEMSKKRS
jgi:hypothetical protein